MLAIHRTIGFRNWKDQPFAKSYLGIEGAKGRFLGFYAVIMQAAFSFFGSEVPDIVCPSLCPHHMMFIQCPADRQQER